jgi:hypothetical protein
MAWSLPPPPSPHSPLFLTPSTSPDPNSKSVKDWNNLKEPFFTLEIQRACYGLPKIFFLSLCKNVKDFLVHGKTLKLNLLSQAL